MNKMMMMNKETLMKRLADASQNKIYPLIIPRNELPLRKILLTTRLWNHVRRQQALVSMSSSSSSSNNWVNQQDTNDLMGKPENTCIEQPQKVPPPVNDDVVSKQLSIPENPQQSTDDIIATCEWPWFSEEAPKTTLLDSLNEENNSITEEIHQLPQIGHTSSSSNGSSGSDLLSHEIEDRKRPRYVLENEEAEEEEVEDEEEEDEEEQEENEAKKAKKAKILNSSQHEDDILCSSSSINHHNSLHFSLDAPASPAGPASPPPTAPNSPPVLLSA